MPIEFACPACNKRFRVQDNLAGKLAKCAGCGDKIRIPPQKRTAAAASSRLDDILDDYPVSAEEEEESAAAELAELEEGVEPVKKTSAVPRCPACGMKFVGTTIICVHCGYDTKIQKGPPQVATEARGRSGPN